MRLLERHKRLQYCLNACNWAVLHGFYFLLAVPLFWLSILFDLTVSAIVHTYFCLAPYHARAISIPKHFMCEGYRCCFICSNGKIAKPAYLKAVGTGLLGSIGTDLKLTGGMFAQVDEVQAATQDEAFEKHFDFWVCHIDSLQGLHGFIKYEEAQKKGILVQLPPGQKALFLSHRWFEQNHPDDAENQKFCSVLFLFKEKAWVAAGVRYFWLDYMCAPQNDLDLQKQAIDSLPYYIRECTYFVSLYGENSTCERALLSAYNGRGWCRLERFVALAIFSVHTHKYNMNTHRLQNQGIDAVDIKYLNPMGGQFRDGGVDGELEKQRVAPMLYRLCAYAEIYCGDEKIQEVAGDIKESLQHYLLQKQIVEQMQNEFQIANDQLKRQLEEKEGIIEIQQKRIKELELLDKMKTLPGGPSAATVRNQTPIPGAQNQEWCELLNRACQSCSPAWEWLLQTLTDWLPTFLLECPDSLARNSFVQLVTKTVTAAAKCEDEALKDATAEQAGISRPSDKAMNRSLIVKLIFNISLLFCEVSAHVRNADELFLLIGELAACNDSIRRYLVSLEMVARLANYVMKDRSPKELMEAYPEIHVYGCANQLPDFCHVLEAIAILLGGKQVKKAPLLEDFASAYILPELTNAAHAALTVIFKENCRQQPLPVGMDIQDFLKYMECCGHNTQNLTTSNLKAMLQKYDKLPDNRLSLEGFLQYYRDTASMHPSQVWQDLYAFHFRSDLRRGEPEMDSHSTIGGILFDERDRVQLPPLSQLALGTYAFYERANDQVEGTAAAILICACKDNVVISTKLIQECLQEMTRLMPGWQGQNATEVVCNVLHQLSVMKDSCWADKLETLFNTDFGIFTQSKKCAKHIQQHPTDYQQNQLLTRYRQILKSLYVIPDIKTWLDQRRGEWEWLLNWTCNIYGRAPSSHMIDGFRGGSEGDSEEDGDSPSAVEKLHKFGGVDYDGSKGYEQYYKTAKEELDQIERAALAYQDNKLSDEEIARKMQAMFDAGELD